MGQTFWTLRVPALSRALVQRIRRSLGEDRSLRIDELTYELPSGGTGFATLVAVPLVHAQENVGTVLVFEDSSRAVALANENKALKEKLRTTRRRRKNE
jgi:two-component system CheB/CheR fusion protein